MASNGYVRMHRGWMDNPAFENDPFRCRAWMWLIEQAAWKPTKVSIKGKTVQLDRGQLSHSIRHMAAAWQWDQSKARRFLTRLQTDAMIDTANDTGQTIITICNYSQYQDAEARRDTVNDTASDTGATQERHNKREEVKKTKKETNIVPPPIVPPLPERDYKPTFDNDLPSFLDRRKPESEIKPETRNLYTPEFAEFWGEYPKRLNASKKAAFEAWEKLLKAGDPPEEIIHGARCYAAYCEASGTVGKFVAHHQTWLNQARHREYAFDTPTEIYETTQRESHDNGSGKRSDIAVIDEASRRFLARGGE